MAGASRIVRLVSAQEDTDLSIELQEGVNRIGRQRTDNHIVLVSPQVSRFHAEIHVGKDIIARDLGSANGTFVNGERVKERKLRPGDLVGFSDQFTLRLTVDMLEDPTSMTLSSGRGPDAMPKAPPPKAPPLLSVDSVPISLEERNRRLQNLASYKAEEPTSARRPPTGPVVTPSPSDPVPYAPMNTGPPKPSPVAGAGAAARPAAGASSRARRPPSDAMRPSPLPSSSPSPVAPQQPSHRSSRPAAPAHPPAPAQQVHARGPTAAFGEARPHGHAPSEPAPPPPQYGHPVPGPDDQEQKQMAQLYQISKRCMSAQTLAELDRLLINTMENAVQFERGFVTYQLPSGDWKLVMSPKGDRWERRMVRDLLQASLRAAGAQLVVDSRKDNRLGQRDDGSSDQRLLLPLRTQDSPVGTIFLIAGIGALDERTVDFLTLFADVAALAIVNCARIDRGL